MSDTSSHRYKFVVIGLVACSTLIHEILLTRVCALRLYHHFTFLVISNCLLGMGASGTLLSIYQERWKLDERRTLAWFIIGYALCLVVTYAFLLTYQIPVGLDLGKSAHLQRFVIFNLAGAVPFFFGGAVIGMLLSFNPARVNRLYATDLVGAGIGCIACPALLPLVGAGGVFIVTLLLATAALVAVAYQRFRGMALGIGAVVGAILLWQAPSFDQRFPVPAKGFIDVARAIEAEVTDDFVPYSVWTANSRIDLTSPPAGTENGMFGRGHKTEGLPPHPEFKGISQDATAGTVVINFSDHPEGLGLIRRSTYSAAVNLKKNPRVFIIGLGGGNDVWAAKHAGAARVKAVELNWPIVDIHQRVMRQYSRGFVEDPNVEIVVDEGRSALMRETERYDVIQMSGVDTWTALASGAYVLAENYLYTKEALTLMYERLEDGGILQVTRFSETMEALRMLSNMHAALESLGRTGLQQSFMALASEDKVMALLFKKGIFTIEEQRAFLSFAAEAGLRVVYVPMFTNDDPIWTFLHTGDKAEAIANFPRDISPTTDDRPYFFNYTKWNDPFATSDSAGDLPSLSQGNPFFILTQFIISLVLSAVLIVLPLVRRGGLPRRGSLSYLTYFAGLGLGFIFVEIAAMQKLTLFLGQPVYSLTVTLFSLLVFTGLGSLFFAGRLPTDGRGLWKIPVALIAYVASFATLTPFIVDSFIALALPARVLITVVLLAPAGLLLGVPFAFGLRVLADKNPRLLPWAWAVNGCFSVVGSILTVVISMNAGFNAVLFVAAIVYAGAFAALSRELRREPATP